MVVRSIVLDDTEVLWAIFSLHTYLLIMRAYLPLPLSLPYFPFARIKQYRLYLRADRTSKTHVDVGFCLYLRDPHLSTSKAPRCKPRTN